MKHLLILILDHGEIVDTLFKSLSANHYNATVFNARSIKHLLEDEEHDEMHFINLSHLNTPLFAESTFCYFVVDEEKIEELKSLIREGTDSFKKIKGAMFSYALSNYEGSI